MNLERFNNRFSRSDILSLSSEDGAVFVEAAIAFLPLMIFLLATMSIGITGFHILGLQHALFRAARVSSLGPLSVGEIRTELINTGQSLGININTEGIIICPSIQTNCTHSTSFVGAPGQFVRISARKRVKGPLFMTSFDIVRSVIVKNEPF